jgi:epoxide hydrolase
MPVTAGLRVQRQANLSRLGTDRIADAWDQLMGRLGYTRYGAQGGDWGSRVTTALGRRHPEHVVGIHLNMVFAFPDPGETSDLTKREQAALAALGYHRAQGSGYAAVQSTRPQSIGYGLVDSPAEQPVIFVNEVRAAFRLFR